MTNKSFSTATEIAGRLRSFGQQHYGEGHGWKKLFADALGISSQHLDRYLSGSSAPGNTMYLRLIHLGCDVQWLLTGRQASQQTPLSPNEKAMLAELRKAGIMNAQEVRYFFDTERLATEVGAAAAREVRSRYTKKRAVRRK